MAIKLLSALLANSIRKLSHSNTAELSSLRRQSYFVGSTPGSWGVVDLTMPIRTNNLQYCVALYFVGKQKAAMFHTAQDLSEEQEAGILKKIIGEVDPQKIIVTSNGAHVSAISESGNMIAQKAIDSRLESLRRLKQAYSNLNKNLPKIEEQQYHTSHIFPKGVEVVGCQGDSVLLTPSRSILLRALEAVGTKNITTRT